MPTAPAIPAPTLETILSDARDAAHGDIDREEDRALISSDFLRAAFDSEYRLERRQIEKQNHWQRG